MSAYAELPDGPSSADEGYMPKPMHGMMRPLSPRPRYCHHCGTRMDLDGMVEQSPTERGACVECAPAHPPEVSV